MGSNEDPTQPKINKLKNTELTYLAADQTPASVLGVATSIERKTKWKSLKLLLTLIAKIVKLKTISHPKGITPLGM